MNKLTIETLVGLCVMFLVIGCGSKDNEYLDRMSEEHEGETPVENAASDLNQSAEVSGEEVTYATVNGNEITGYIAKPEESAGENPGIIVIHEW